MLLRMIWIAIRYAICKRNEASHQWVVIALMATFLIGILGMGVVVSNAGNGFRMRISIVPFLILAAALAWNQRSVLMERFPYND